jgi:hypothetical protein
MMENAMFRIEPFGVRTGRTEQLSSFSARYAEAMSVTFSDFYRKYLFPMLYEGKPKPPRANLISRAVIDGMAKTAVDWTTALQKACSVGDLTGLTMLPFQGSVAPKRLVTLERRWCPQCLQAMAEKDSAGVYEPLVWRLEEVEVCSRHNRPLSAQCPKCGKGGQLPLVFNFRVGCCRHCGSWMGSQDEFEGKGAVPDAFQLYTAKQCEDLLALPGQLSDGEHVLPSSVAASAIREVFFQGNGSAMARSLGSLPGQINAYTNGEFPAPLYLFLRAGFSTGATMHQMFVSNGFESSELARPDTSFELRRAEPKRYGEQVLIDNMLKEALQGDGSASVRSIAINLCLEPLTVWRRSPKLSAEVSKQHAAFRATSATKLRREFEQEVQIVISSFEQRGHRPSSDDLRVALRDPACFLNDWKRTVIHNAMSSRGWR